MVSFRSLISTRMLAVYIIVAAITTITVSAALRLVPKPEFDEFAYFANGLYYSGVDKNFNQLIVGSEQYQPFFAERPPLIWWMLTALFSLGLNPYVAIVISPLFAVLLALLITQFAYEFTGDIKAGLFAGIITGISGYYASMSAHVLTDTPGTFFAALTVYAFYEYVFKEKRIYAPVMGAALGFSLVMRDENMILIPLLIVAWILFAMKDSPLKKLAYIVILTIVLGVPVLLLHGLVNTLQEASYILTPIVMNGWPVIVLVSAIAAYAGFKMKRQFLLGEMAAAFLAFFVIMLPFFFDNYLIGNVLYYIAGKGILARPVSHLIMVPQTGGEGAGLPITLRAEGWISSLPALVSLGIMIAAILGLYYMVRADRKLFAFLFLWLVVTLGFVVFGTQFEDRFLMIAFAPIVILAGIGLAFIWKLNPFAGILSVGISAVLADFVPRLPQLVSNLTLVSGFSPGKENWLYTFIPTLTLSHPAPSITFSNMADGFVALIFGVVLTLLILKNSIVEPSIASITEEQTEEIPQDTPVIIDDTSAQSLETQDSSTLNG